jgi:hypothetical protein
MEECIKERDIVKVQGETRARARARVRAKAKDIIN